MTKLKPGDTLQPGDVIQRHSPYINHGSPEHEHRDTKPHPIRPWTVGRVLLPGCVMIADYYRP